MPEGDTIHRTAARLRPALVGRDLRRFLAPRLVGEPPVPGDRVDAVEAVGKHLLVRFAGGLVLETHLRMTGSWHLYRTGERWRKPERAARVVIEVDDWVAVCFSAPVVRTHRSAGPAGSFGPGGPVPAGLAHLGPDLCRPEPDLDEAVARMARFCDDTTEIHHALLDQRVVAGIGNVYKSEVLWACGIAPTTRVVDLPAPARRELMATAARLLAANLTTAARTTVPGGLAVYGRAGAPCLRCGAPVRMDRWGGHARSTYWCPRCQRPPG